MAKGFYSSTVMLMKSGNILPLATLIDQFAYKEPGSHIALCNLISLMIGVFITQRSTYKSQMIYMARRYATMGLIS